MKKKVIGIIAAIVVMMGLGLVVYNQIIPNEYVPADDEIALHLQLDTEEDVGLLVYDYRADSNEYSGGISNADGSLIKHDSDNIVVLNKEDLNNIADTFELSMQFRIITEYVAPNYENVYPDIMLCEDDSVRLLRSLNPDAEDGVQGEEFGEEWTLSDRGAAAAAFLNNGFWKTWTDINGTACGGINLYDQLCEEGVRQFMEMNDHPFVVCNDEYDAANAVLSLSPGLYLFYVPVLYDIPSESDAENADTLPDADTCSEEEIIESEAFKTVYEHAIAGGMSKDDAYTEAYAAALQEISPFAIRIGFVNPDTGSDDETEFDVNSIFEALNLFRNDFREDNHWKEMPKILYIESDK